METWSTAWGSRVPHNTLRAGKKYSFTGLNPAMPRHLYIKKRKKKKRAGPDFPKEKKRGSRGVEEGDAEHCLGFPGNSQRAPGRQKKIQNDLCRDVKGNKNHDFCHDINTT